MDDESYSFKEQRHSVIIVPMPRWYARSSSPVPLSCHVGTRITRSWSKMFKLDVPPSM